MILIVDNAGIAKFNILNTQPEYEHSHKPQKVLEGEPEGHVRLFIAPVNIPDKSDFECTVREEMSKITNDDFWNNSEKVKHLTLEHMMAAVRMGFSGMFGTLGKWKSQYSALIHGELPVVRLFSEYVLPLYQLEKLGESHGVMTHLRRARSPLLDPNFLRTIAPRDNPLSPLKNAILSVIDVIDAKSDVSFFEVLQCIAEHNLFSIPQSLTPFSKKMEYIEEDRKYEAEVNKEEDKVSSLEIIQDFLETPFRQIEAYKTYVSGKGVFDTHQGVKGREFDRVMVIMDDEEAGGFLFSYEKMFEVKPLTQADLDKVSKGEEVGIDRTRRLFYVTCTRAEKSLALVAYSQDPQVLKERVIRKGWFEDFEVILQA
ncbi:Pathogenesis-related protein (fragment) [Xenorhabdus bovienii str. oregonense]|uniref:Pathogenesis-related protein n=1 Tax=Xenorhabdus bovienii str. oregonense TaxID=1398202 RepID=A0A077P505_XENBV